ncbi:MAG: tRNA lysidine(34) synthetase TilS [Planctomycetota bacterium]
MAQNPRAPSYLPLVRAVAYGLRHRAAVPEGGHLLVACSGGADSVALLRALGLLHRRRKWNLTLSVAHVQHHLRPPDAAEGDAASVEHLAEQLGLAYHRRDIAPGDTPGNTEANAREQRYAALHQIARDIHAPFVATAHHADDQLETLLMAILRGTTAKGLRGIAWTRPLGPRVQLIRPMLGATRAEAVELLEHLGQSWREDATNRDPSRTRARLRHEVLPVLRELRPSVARKALELSEALRKDY